MKTADTKILDVIDQDGKKVSDLKLNQKLFDGSVNKSLLHEAIVMYQANTRLGCASTKGMSEVRGGGRKPWRQKGTGRARAGSIRSPLWRGGGVIFGPLPRDYYYRLPKKALKGALRSAINDKINENRMIVIDKIDPVSHKTKDFINSLKKLKIDSEKEKVLIVVNLRKENLLRATNNLEKINILTGSDVNAYNVILMDRVVIEKDAFKTLEKRLVI
ncbi:MAG: 50S ribosomal protein L4 [Candidatus Omnitrophota bacterium]